MFKCSTKDRYIPTQYLTATQSSHMFCEVHSLADSMGLLDDQFRVYLRRSHDAYYRYAWAFRASKAMTGKGYTAEEAERLDRYWSQHDLVNWINTAISAAENDGIYYGGLISAEISGV